ncbi:CadD family cadmium resistance transporter [Salinicoccus siamensis]|uniref:CadD family cadmium resistance transporter n=1 Tax=Salinicoccus siamensis TaxID=381830 RepID=UPI00360B0C7D
MATAIDLIAILLIFFARAETDRQIRQIYIGQYVGSLILIMVSLILAYMLGFIPEKWILGLLGLIPIYFGVKVLLAGDPDEAEPTAHLDKKGMDRLTGKVVMIIIGSCGADNTGLFVPYFVTIDAGGLAVSLMVFLIFIFLLAFTAHGIAHTDLVGETIEKYGTWIMALIYIGLGVFILYENETGRRSFSFSGEKYFLAAYQF